MRENNSMKSVGEDNSMKFVRENDSTKSGIRSLIGNLTRFGVKRFSRAILLAAMCCAAVSVVQAAPLDVTTFGAIGDNATDNRAFIQDAIDSLGAAGGTVYFPPGYYRVSGTISVPSNIRLQGMGSTVYNTQIRLTATHTALFEVTTGSSNIVFKDLLLYGDSRPVWPRNTPAEAALIRTEGTTGISLRTATGGGGISNVVIENVRVNQFTYGIAATTSGLGLNGLVTNVKIRNYASDGNEYSLYANTKGADGWDVQNMNVYPMYDKQNGIFLERSGQMRFLQLSCAGPGAGVCAKLWDNGDTYFRQMHVEGPRLSLCAGSDCDPINPSYAGENSSTVTIETSAADGEFHRATNIVSINNRFWLDFPQPPAAPPASYKFFGTGANSALQSCGNVWVSWNPSTHMTNTTVTAPATAFPGLATAVQGCVNSSLTAVPVFATGYEADTERLNGEVSVLTHGATPNGGGDDTTAFVAAISAARALPSKRVFVPAGTYDISSTLALEDGETVLGEAGSTINLKTAGFSLFRVLNRVGSPVIGISFRNLTLTSDSDNGTIGINFENASASAAGAASDFQIQNVDFNGFDTGIAVRPVGGTLANPSPMFDSVSVKDGDFTNNKIAVLIRSANASHWNLENLRVNIPGGAEGVRIDYAGHVSVRNLSCVGSGSGAACLTLQRQSGTSVEGLTAGGVLNALVVPWENGWTQFPVTLRNNDLRAGVYFQGRTYLNSVGNVYPAKLRRFSTARDVIFGAYQEGDPNNVAYGGLSDIFSCNDVFRDTSPGFVQSTWVYVGTLNKPITYCY